jgi:EmrB/QacA subfamily drug resistance transporter
MTKQQRLILLIAILASFVSFLDGSIVNVALPAISRDLHGGLTLQQWVVDAYLITQGSLMLIAGSLSDLFGRKKILQVGLVAFGITSVLCAIAPTGLFLIISRVLQGTAAALLVPSSLAFIMSSFSGQAQGKAVGTWTAWTGMAFIMGALVGGFLVDTVSWQAIFLINVVPIAVTLWLLHRLAVPEKIRDKTPLDIRGAAIGAIGTGAPVYALIEQAHYGWSSPAIYIPLIAGVAALIYFVRYEQRAAHPMLPMGLFKARNFSAGNLATLAVYGGLSIATFLIAIFVQQFGGYTALQAGISMLPVTIIMFFLSSKFGGLAAKYGPRFFMGFGPLVASLGYLWMLRVDETVSYWTQLFPGIVLFGIGLSITVAPLTSAILGCINPQQAGIASAVNNAISRLAALLAIAAIGLITGPGNLSLADFHHGVVAIIFLLVSGGVISLIGIQNNAPRIDAVEASATA